MKNYIFTLMMLVSLSALCDQAMANNTTKQDADENTNHSMSWHQKDNVVYVSQAYQDKHSEQTMTTTQRITFDAKGQATDNEVIIQSSTGLKVFSVQQLVDDMKLQKLNGQNSDELLAFIEVMDNSMVAAVGRLLAQQQLTVFHRGACGAATSYVAFTWSQFAGAVIAGNTEAANYWMFENSWAISEMRIFCEIE